MSEYPCGLEFCVFWVSSWFGVLCVCQCPRGLLRHWQRWEPFVYRILYPCRKRPGFEWWRQRQRGGLWPHRNDWGIIPQTPLDVSDHCVFLNFLNDPCSYEFFVAPCSISVCSIGTESLCACPNPLLSVYNNAIKNPPDAFKIKSDLLEPWSSTFPMLWPFDTVPRVVLIPTHKVTLVATSWL